MKKITPKQIADALASLNESGLSTTRINTELIKQYNADISSGKQESESLAFFLLIEKNKNLIQTFARKFPLPELEDHSTIESLAKLYLVRAIRTYNIADSTASFSTYATTVIKNGFLIDILQHQNTLCGVAEKKKRLVSFDQVVAEESDHEVILFEPVDPDSSKPLEHIENVDSVVSILKKCIYLTPTEQKSIALYYGIGCQKQDLISIGDEIGKSKCATFSFIKNARRKLQLVLKPYNSLSQSEIKSRKLIAKHTYPLITIFDEYIAAANDVKSH